MNRREFLRFLGVGAVSAAAPKFIFDMGANLYKQRSEIFIHQGWIDGERYLVTPKNIYSVIEIDREATCWVKKNDVILFNNGMSIKLS